MNTKKLLNMVGITPIRSLNFEEVNNIINGFAQMLLISFPNLKLNYAQICKTMFECRMYLAKFDSNLGNANYVHKNNSIYIRENAIIDCRDKYILHECIHYFQTIRDEKGALKKIGICDFEEFKVKGLALNEAAIQFVVAKMLELPNKNIICYELPLQTNSQDYYPIISDLINKILYFINEESLVDSVLFSTDKFKLELIEYCGEDAFNSIENNFDTILELEQAYENDNKIIEKIKKTYKQAQTTLYTSYFNNVYYMLETIKEVEDYKTKLIEFEDELTLEELKEEYKQYKEKQLEKLEKKIIQISKKNARNTLAVISNNKIFALFRAIRRIFIRE